MHEVGYDKTIINSPRKYPEIRTKHQNIQSGNTHRLNVYIYSYIHSCQNRIKLHIQVTITERDITYHLPPDHEGNADRF